VTTGGSSVAEVQRCSACAEVRFVVQEGLVQHLAFQDILLLVGHNFFRCLRRRQSIRGVQPEGTEATTELEGRGFVS